MKDLKMIISYVDLFYGLEKQRKSFIFILLNIDN